MWLDIVPGGENSADTGAKQIRFTVNFVKKGGVFSGAAPFQFESEDATRILLKQAPAAR
jgi:hypothetical protein